MSTLVENLLFGTKQVELPHTDKLPGGYVMLFPTPDYLVRTASKHPGATGLMDEYNSLVATLRLALPAERLMAVAEHRGSISRQLDYFKSRAEIKAASRPIDDITKVKFRGDFYEKIHIRDWVNTYAGEVFIAWRWPANLPYQRSAFAEGGGVLQAKGCLVISQTLTEGFMAWAHQTNFQNREFQVSPVPAVDPKKQPEEKRWFVEGHIDGHANLVVDKHGRVNLLVAKSYLRQDEDTTAAFSVASQKLNAELIEICDEDLIGLPLNFEQLEDGSLIYSPAGAALDKTLDELVGPDKIFKTIPLVDIPRYTRAGIRCNIKAVPLSFLKFAGKFWR